MKTINYESEICNIGQRLKFKVLDDYKSHINVDLTFDENLLTLLKLENDLRDKRFISRRIKQADFPVQKTIDTFEFDAKRLPHLKKDVVMELLKCDFIKDKTNICAIGPCGVGKTHLMSAIAMEAIRKGYTVKFRRACDLATQLAEAESEKRLGNMLKTLHSCQVLLLDEVGYLTMDQKSSSLIFQVLAGRYEVSSTIVTSNLEFSKWPEFIGDPVMARALVDRLVHRSTILNMNGEGYRILDSKRKSKKNYS
jgi:DNA replication protein DnaC